MEGGLERWNSWYRVKGKRGCQIFHGVDDHLCVCQCLSCQPESGCYSLSCLQLHAKILPGFSSGISQRCWGGHLPNTTLNTSLCKNTAIYSLLEVFIWVFALTLTHASYLFSLHSLWGLKPFIVSQTGTREKQGLGFLGVRMRERGKAGYKCLGGGSCSLISLPTFIFRMIVWACASL